MTSIVLFTLLAAAMLLGTATADDIRAKMAAVNAGNCHNLSAMQLKIQPDYRLTNNLKHDDRIQRMKTAVLDRAFFFSFILQRLNTSRDFNLQPNQDYYYLSSSTLAASVPEARASGVYFDKNVMYPNFDYVVPFNATYPLFGVRAVRADDSKDTFHLVDMAAMENYTSSTAERYTPWYRIFLPEMTYGHRWRYKTRYIVMERQGFFPQRYQAFPFVGPTSETDSQVQLTTPYFDCGRTNKWIVTAVAPIIDFLPRYMYWHHLRKFRTVAVATMDIDFDPLSFANKTQKPNVNFADYLSDQKKAKLLNHLRTVSKSNCQQLPVHNLSIAGYMIDGRAKVFSQQMRTAERLANFASGALRIRKLPLSREPGYQVLPIVKDQMMGETISAVMADPRIKRMGIYFMPNQNYLFRSMGYLAPVAWREPGNGPMDNFKVKNLADDLFARGYNYTKDSLLRYFARATPPNYSYVHKITGTAEEDVVPAFPKPSFTVYGMSYPAVTPGSGWISAVYYDCRGSGGWFWNYTVPFNRFINGKKRSQEYAGVVSVTISVTADDFNPPQGEK